MGGPPRVKITVLALRVCGRKNGVDLIERQRTPGAGLEPPHGAFARENFKSFVYTEKLFDLLGLFPSNVKVL